VRFEVVAAYHGLWAARRLAELTRESLAAAEKHREVAEARRQASLGARPDVARAEVEVADARLAMAQADTAARAARASLAHAMGLSPGTPFEIVDAEPEPGPLPPAPASHADRPEVRALLLDAEASRADAEAAAAGYWPEVTVAASYGVSDDRFFPTEQVWYVGAAVDVPLLSWWSTGASIDSAEAQASATEARSETLENAAALEVDAARLAIDEANARLEASAAMIASAEENVRVAEGLYAEGAGSMIEVVDARDALQRARMARITGLRDLALAAARYRYAVGEEP
jgi:cobalt-zinc-cadmium efflux system outer membrane protein